MSAASATKSIPASEIAVLPAEATPSRCLSLRRNCGWTLAGNGVYLACQYGTLMAVAKLGNPTMVGEFSMALAITAPVVIFSQMQLRNAQITDVKGEYRFADYFFFRLLLTLIALAVIELLTVASGYSGAMALLILLVGSGKAVTSLSDIAYGSMQKHERMDLLSISMMFKGLASLAVFSVSLWAGYGLLCASAGMAAVWAVLLLVYDLPMQCRVSGEKAALTAWKRTTVKRLFLLSLPLAMAAGLTSVSANIPRYFLEGFHGKHAVAMFSVAAAPLALITVLTGAAAQATQARAAVYYQSGDFSAFKRLVMRVALVYGSITVCCTLVFALLGETLIAILFTPEYQQAASLLVVMSCGLIVSTFAVFGFMLFTAGRMFWLQLAAPVLGILVQVPACWWLAQRYSTTGVAWTVFAKHVVCAGLVFIIGWCILRCAGATGSYIPGGEDHA